MTTYEEVKAWRQKNPEKVAAQQRRYRERKNEQRHHDERLRENVVCLYVHYKIPSFIIADHLREDTLTVRKIIEDEVKGEGWFKS